MNWKHKTKGREFSYFQKLSELLGSQQINPKLHLEALKDEFTRYFPNLGWNLRLKLLRNPFQAQVEETKDHLQDKLIGLKNCFEAKDLFTEVFLNQF